jgi:PAS domain S-box-containing protein
VRSAFVNKFIAVMSVLWTLAIFGFFIKDALHLKKSITGLAEAEARTHYRKDLSTRLWAASHGGVYVPAGEGTPPNPQLSHIPDRDIVTSTGKLLTLMNPAYLARHMMEYHSKQFGVRSHLTSLKPFRTENAPDEWEKNSLSAFEDGYREMLEISEIDGEPFLRLMLPIKTEESCLKCHRHQGYEEGDVRGGSSVSVPLQHYMTMWRQEVAGDAASSALIWFLGLSGLLFYGRQISKPLRKLERTEASLRISQENYRTLVENSLTGIYVSQDDIIVLANAEFARIHGYALDDIIGMNALKFVHPEDRPMVLERSDPSRGGLPPADIYRIRALTKSGSTVYVQRRVTLTTFNGRPAVIGNEIDITGQMVAESETAASERQLRRLADGLIELREVEHGQFAKEIHENIAQCISAIKFKVESVLQQKGEAHDLLQPILPDFQHTMTEILRIARQYKPMILDHVGIIRSIAWLCAQFKAANPSLQIEKSFYISEAEFPEALKIIVFRMVEQMLESLSRYSDATVHIGLELVSDKIIFFFRTSVSLAELTEAPSEGVLHSELALIALKRRCERLGGSFLLSSAHRDETLLIATWNLYCKYPPDHITTG